MKDRLRNLGSAWTKAEGPYAEIVLSTRIRLARNLKGSFFPSLKNERQLNEVLQLAEGYAAKHADIEVFRMNELTEKEREYLFEKHLISNEMKAATDYSAALITGSGDVSIMVNEEDHFRIQCFAPGLDLANLPAKADEIDDELEETIDFAFDTKFGYLTSCPTNLGTGLRASLMLHLPGLVLTGQAQRIFTSLLQYGIVVRGLYGENTEALGRLFQVSNQLTLGQSEKEIYANVYDVGKKIIDQEKTARDYLVQKMGIQIEDRVNRAYGILKNAKILPSDEALNLISDLRLGTALGIVEGTDLRLCNELFLLGQPAALQLESDEESEPIRRDIRRAELIQNKLTASKGGG